MNFFPAKIRFKLFNAAVVRRQRFTSRSALVIWKQMKHISITLCL